MFKRLLDPKAVMFCVAVANMVQVWLHSDEGRFETNFLLSFMVLISTLLLFIKRLWSNFLVAVFTGLLPISFAFEILEMSINAEVSLFGLTHMKLVAELIMRIPGIFLLLLVLCVSILACAYCSLAQLVALRRVSSDC